MRRLKTDPQSVIRCGTADNAKLAYIAMFRYAFGRMTYMPSVVVAIIRANADTLTTETLELFDRELTDEAERYERVWRGKVASNYGMECDRETWLAFHAWVKGELRKRLPASAGGSAAARKHGGNDNPALNGAPPPGVCAAQGGEA